MLAVKMSCDSPHADLDSSSVKQRAVFLIRDGVINVNSDYIHHSENFEFIDGTFDEARASYARNYTHIVITNQAGIGRGYFSKQEFHQLTTWMCN